MPRLLYAYLLGMYLGDGCISAHPRGVYRLRIALDARYPNIIDECAVAMAAVLPNAVGRTRGPGLIEVGAYSKHWPCLFPQHGAGPKHHRSIRLEPWQTAIALNEHPRALLRGLMQSDGCTATNRIKRIKGPGPMRLYSYRRSQFSNRSADIRELFSEACRLVGIECRPSNAWTISISRSAHVRRMDEFVGPKS